MNTLVGITQPDNYDFADGIFVDGGQLYIQAVRLDPESAALLREEQVAPWGRVASFVDGDLLVVPQGPKTYAPNPETFLGESPIIWLQGSREASYILYSKDPHYRLMPTESGPRRWMLVTRSGDELPKSSSSIADLLLNSRSQGTITDKIVDWRHKDDTKGHSSLFIVRAAVPGDPRGEGQYTLKWNDADAGRFRDYLLEEFGAHHVVDLLPEYEELYRMVGAIYMPQWYSGDVEDLPDDLLKAMDEDSNVLEQLEDPESGVAPILVSSTYVDQNHIPWKYFGETPEEASRNAEFLEDKTDIVRVLVGPPDRDNLGNYLRFWLTNSDDEADMMRAPDIRAIRTDIDFDWYPDLSDGDWERGAYSGPAAAHALELNDVGDGVPWSDIQRIANSSLSRVFEDFGGACCDEDFEGLKARIGHEGMAQPHEEALLDVMSHLRDFKRVPKGHLPTAVFKAMEETYLDMPNLQDAVESWEQVRDERLKGSSA